MKNWSVVIANEEDTVFSVLEKINSTGYQFVVVTNEKGVLVGTVTDGDIRRGLIHGVPLDGHISDAMNRNPVVAQFGMNPTEIRSLMTERKINHLPIVDKDMVILEIISLVDLPKVAKKENSVVLMAGGLGTRLARLTADCPKSMLKVGGKPILETIIRAFMEHGFYRFTIAVNYKAEMIEDYFKDGSHMGIEVTYIKEKTRLGTAGALSLLENHHDLPFIVINGDLLTKINFSGLLDFHLNKLNDATMCLKQYEHQIPFGVVSMSGENVLRIEEKPIRSYFVNGGIYILNPHVLSMIPKDTYYDMPTFFEFLIEKGRQVGGYPFGDYWIDIGRMDDFERANLEFLEFFK